MKDNRNRHKRKTVEQPKKKIKSEKFWPSTLKVSSKN